jgi:glycosyltransferase involved in cell wall biosynthesis
MISVAMITHNEEAKLPKTLAALKDLADEIVIVDSHSVDKTRDIAREYGAQIFEEDWKGFGGQKNSAISHCHGDWVLMLDADEELTEELCLEIKELAEKGTYNVYKIPRITWTFGHKTRQKDSTVRLARRTCGYYDNKEVHESWVYSGSVGQLKNALNHYTYLTYNEYFEKFNRYTASAARDMYKAGRHASIFYIVCNCTLTFFKHYVLKCAFLDGRQGFVNSVLGFFYNFIKYVRLEELRRNFK